MELKELRIQIVRLMFSTRSVCFCKNDCMSCINVEGNITGSLVVDTLCFLCVRFYTIYYPDDLVFNMYNR